MYANFSPNPESPHFRVANKHQLYTMPLATQAPLGILEHWSIQATGDEWLDGKRELHDSYFAGLGTAGDKGPVALPEKYVVIQPYSTNARKVYRDVNTDEWQAILMWLTRIGLQGLCSTRAARHFALLGVEILSSGLFQNSLGLRVSPDRGFRTLPE